MRRPQAPWQRLNPARPTPAEARGTRLLFSIGTNAPVPEMPAPRARPEAATGAHSQSRRGTAVEGGYHGQGAAATLRREGYTPMPSHGGFTAADVNAVKADPTAPGPSLRRVQVKRQHAYAPSGLNDAVRGWLGLGNHRTPATLAADEQREAWLWCDERRGWIARIVVGRDGTVRALDGSCVEEVIDSIERMLARERERGTAAGFRARLGLAD